MQQTIDLNDRHAGVRRPAEPDARHWTTALGRYRAPILTRSLAELVVSAVPFVALWLAMLLSLRYSYWLGLILAMPTAGFLVRLFMIQHDCGHGSFFRRRRANDWLGRALGVLTLTPYDYWRRTHAMHHATSGHLGRRGTGDIDTLTVREYRGLPAWRRARYRLKRHPIVVLGVAPVYLFVLQHRLPVNLTRAGWAPWLSVMATNLAIAVVLGLLIALLGMRDVLLVQAPITLLASSAGVCLFYVQHQFEHTYWAWESDWSLHTSALHGSSHYDLPPVLRWFTANIGIHHVHHLCSRIPCYRLGEVLREHPELRAVSRLTLRESFRCLRLALWDEDQRRLVGFSDARASLISGLRTDPIRASSSVSIGATDCRWTEIAASWLMQISVAARRLR
jgi:omega-6 fatty acid desaturase (delta-12 desaturase)